MPVKFALFPAGLLTWTLRIKTKRKTIAAQLGLLMATAPITVRVSFTPYLSFITSVCCILFSFIRLCVSATWVVDSPDVMELFCLGTYRPAMH